MTAHSLCFAVHGDHLTEVARARCIEGRFDHGFRILHEGLDGISTDQVLSILRGSHKLIGINDVSMVPDTDQEWPQKLLYHHAGVWITPRGRYLRPYAVVTSWGPDDMKNAEEITPDSDHVARSTNTFAKYHGEYAGRSLFYADDPKRDVLKLLKVEAEPDLARGRDGTVSVLFREVANHPFQLVPAHNSAQAALDAFLNVRALEDLGYIQSFPRDVFKVRYECEDPTEECPAIRSELEFGTTEGGIAMRTLGVYRNKKIDADKVGMTVKEFEEYENVMHGDDFSKRVDAMNKAYSLAEEAGSRLPLLREAIKQQARGDFIDLEFKGQALRIPRAPFEQWCLWRTDGAHLALPWTPVCPTGMKMLGDDPYHTDFLVGADLEPTAMIDDPDLQSAIYDLRGDTQRAKLNFEVDVLSGKGFVSGKIAHVKPGDEIDDDTIIVIPNCGADYLELALKARGVITEKGGAMAHLVTVAREKKAVIVRIKDARKLYPIECRVDIDASIGKVTLEEGAHKVMINGIMMKL